MALQQLSLTGFEGLNPGKCISGCGDSCFEEWTIPSETNSPLDPGTGWLESKVAMDVAYFAFP